MTLAKSKKPTRAQTRDRLKREASLLDELQRDHQFMLQDIPKKSERFSMIHSLRTGVIQAARRVVLIVPDDSALAAALAKNDKRDKEKR